MILMAKIVLGNWLGLGS